jgi:hypothetical protein
VDPDDDADIQSLLAQPPMLPADALAAQLENSIRRCREAVDEARRNLHSAEMVLIDAEKAVEQAVMAEAFLRCVAPHHPPKTP